MATNSYTATWSASYVYNGPKRNDGWQLFQGDDQSGEGYGDQRSLIGFDMDAILADIGEHAVVTQVSLDYTVEHAWYGNQLTIRWGWHALASKPNTWPSPQHVRGYADVSYTTPTGNKTYILPNPTDIAARMRSGDWKGMVLGPANSTGRLYYCYLTGTGQSSNKPRLTITWTPAAVASASLSSAASITASGTTGPSAEAGCTALAVLDAAGYAQPPTAHLNFPGDSGFSLAPSGGETQADMQFDALAGARPIGALYLRQWGLQIGDM
jgi:hypothetical protein